MSYITIQSPVPYANLVQGRFFKPGLYGLGDAATADSLNTLVQEASAALSQGQMDQVRAKLTPIMEQLTKKMEKSMQDAAIVNAAIHTSLNAIPGVGQVLSAGLSIFQSFKGGEYQDDAKKILAEAQMSIEKKAAESSMRIKNAVSKVVQSESDPAIKQLLSGAAGINGLGFSVGKAFKSIGDAFKSAADWAAKQARDAVKEVDKVTGDIKKEVERGAEYITGRIVKRKAQEAAAKMKEKAGKAIKANETLAMTKINSPEFKMGVRNEIMRGLASDPTIAPLLAQIAQRSISAQQNVDTLKRQASTSSATPLIVGGAVIAALALT